MLRPLTICCALALILAVARFDAHAQSKQMRSAATKANTATIAQIDAYSKAVDQFIKRHEKSARIFGNLASGTTEGPDKWQEFKSDKERERADTGDNLNENALVWWRGGKLVGANFTFQSPSRDWAHFVMYYFREDGTLAKSESTLNTFYGDMTIKRAVYYDASGRVLRRTVRYYDLNTQKPIKPRNSSFDEPDPVYKNVAALPFHQLLGK